MALHLFYVVLLLLGIASTIYYVVNALGSFGARKKRYPGLSNADLGSVTAIIPVYKESPEVFARCIASVAAQLRNVVVVGDGCTEPYKRIAEGYGCGFVTVPHGGKRRAITEGMAHVKTEFVVLLDSDTIVPKTGFAKMLFNFTPTTGGVGVRIKIKITKKRESYISEFFERMKEVPFRAMSRFGTVMVLPGNCTMYRTAAIRPLVESSDFYDFKFLGKSANLADDRQLTSYIMKHGYKAAIAYDVGVFTEAPKSFKAIFRQLTRWARAGYLYFFKELFDGTLFKRGIFYSFSLVYLYALPVVYLSVAAFRMDFLMAHAALLLSVGSDRFYDLFLRMASGISSRHIYVVTMQALSYIGLALFAYSVVHRVEGKRSKRFRTLSWGSLILPMTFVAAIVALFTFWRPSGWMTRG